MLGYLWLIPLGVLVGGCGTLIGAGGGFVLMPVLLLLYPGEDRALLAAISLAVVFFNALSGSVAYGRMKRIDYRSGMMFAAATVPGAVLGALTTSRLPKGLFDGSLAVLLLIVSVFLLFNPAGRSEGREGTGGFLLARRLVDGEGREYRYSFNPGLGVGLSVFVGFVSSVLGIGGGIVHVPALVYLLNFPVHVATATSHFVLAVMAFAGTSTHVAAGTSEHGIFRTLYLAIGVVVGAQFGAALSNRLRGRWIIRGLAVALLVVGVRILVTAF